MSKFSSSREALENALRQYTSLLQDKNSALGAISHSTREMRLRLLSKNGTDIADILDRRDGEFGRLESIRQNENRGLDRMIEAACSAAQSENDELNNLASRLVALQTDYHSLAQGILSCQQECETLMRNRLEETGKAIRESTTRRKLDAAYGPAVRHHRSATSVRLAAGSCMDRQQ